MSSVVAPPATSQSSTSAVVTSGAIANCTSSSSTTTTGPVATMAIIGPNNSNFTTTSNACSNSPAVSSAPNVPSNIATGGFNSTTAINAASSAVATPEGEGQPSNTRFKVVKIDQRPGGKSATKGAEDGLVHEHRLMSNGQKSITYKRGRWTVTDFYDAPPVIPAVTHLSNPPSNSNSTPSTPTPNSFLTTGPRLINVTNVIATGDTSIVHTGGITTPAALDSNSAVIHSPPVLMDFNSNNGHPLAGFAVKPVPVKNARVVVQQQPADCTIESGSGNSTTPAGPAVAANESHYSHHHHQHHHHPRHHGDRKENAENEPPSQSENASTIISGANANVPPCPNSTSKAANNVTSLCNNGNSGNNNNSHASHAISDHGNPTNRTTALASNSQIPLPEESRSKSSNSSNSSSSPSDSDLTTLVTVVGKAHPSKSPKEGAEASGNGPGGGGGGGAAARPHAVKDDATLTSATSGPPEEGNCATGQVVSAEKPPLPQRTGQFYVSPVAEPIINPNPGASVTSSSVTAPDPASGYATPASSIHSVAGTCPQSVQSGIPSAYVVTSVAIDNKIEQAMDLVKSHLMFAVKEEVDVLKEKIVGLLERIQVLETENAILRQAQQQQQLHQQLQQQQQSQLHSQSLLSNINMHPSCSAVAGAQQSSLPTSMIGQANVTDLASAAAAGSSCTSDSCASESLTSIPQSNVPSGSSPGTNLANASTNCATALQPQIQQQQSQSQQQQQPAQSVSSTASASTSAAAGAASNSGPACVPDEPYKK